MGNTIRIRDRRIMVTPHQEWCGFLVACEKKKGPEWGLKTEVTRRMEFPHLSTH